MKSIMSGLVFFFIISQVMPQSYGPSEIFLLDSVIYKRPSIFDYIRKTDKDQFYYNEHQQVYIYEKYNNTHWFPDSLEWSLAERTEYFYDDELRLVLAISQERDWNSGIMNNKLKREYIYDNENYINYSFEWKNLNWEYSAKRERNWDPMKMESSFLLSFWDPDLSEWINYQKDDTLFSVNNIIDTIKNFHWYNPHIMDTFAITWFDYAFIPDTLTTYTDYVKSEQFVYAKDFYDVFINADVTLSFKRYKDSVNYLPYMKKYDYYDTNHNLIFHVKKHWDSYFQQWLYVGAWEYSYNELNLPIEFIYYMGIDSLYPTYKKTFEYNENQLLSKRTYFNDFGGQFTEEENFYYSKYPPEYLENPASPDLLKIFPNPCNTLCYIICENKTFSNYLIYNSSGSIINRGEIANNIEIINMIFFLKYLLNPNFGAPCLMAVERKQDLFMKSTLTAIRCRMYIPLRNLKENTHAARCFWRIMINFTASRMADMGKLEALFMNMILPQMHLM